MKSGSLFMRVVRRLERDELQHLRTLVAEQQQTIERLEIDVADARWDAEQSNQTLMDLEEHGARFALTMGGQLVPIVEERVANG